MDLARRLAAAARSWSSALVQPASAHCDTEHGPAVMDGRRALETGNVNHALKWVHPGGEDEVRAAFDAALAVRGTDSAPQAERQFLETLVRVHRAGEGASFDGIKPTGTDLPPEVMAADAAVESGTLHPLRGLVPEDRWSELERRFSALLERRTFDVDDLGAARDYVASYVSFYKYAEGEDGHHHHGGHAQRH